MTSSLARIVLTSSAAITLAISTSSFADDYVNSSCPSPCTHPSSSTAHVQFQGFRTEAFPYTYYPGELKLRSGKSKRVLVIDSAMNNITPLVPITFQMRPLVNGQPIFASVAAAIDCGGDGTVTRPSNCSVSGHWWLDLDQHPELWGEELSILLWIGTEHQGSQDPILDITVSARLDRK